MKPSCILLVEDNRLLNIYHEKVIRQLGYTGPIHTAENGSHALEYILPSENKDQGECPVPELILLDINMPRVNGWEFLEMIRSKNPHLLKETVIILLTSSPNPDDEKKALAMPEVSGFEKKPMSKEALLALFKKFFGWTT